VFRNGSEVGTGWTFIRGRQKKKEEMFNYIFVGCTGFLVEIS
jgi:hypothetical protein